MRIDICSRYPINNCTPSYIDILSNTQCFFKIHFIPFKPIILSSIFYPKYLFFPLIIYHPFSYKYHKGLYHPIAIFNPKHTSYTKYPYYAIIIYHLFSYKYPKSFHYPKTILYPKYTYYLYVIIMSPMFFRVNLQSIFV